MTFKRFAQKSLLLAAGVYLFLFSLIQWGGMNFHGHEYGFWKHQFEVLNTPMNDTLDYLVLGDSRMMTGLVTEWIPNSYNLSLGGVSSLTSYYQLKRYLQNNPPPKNLFLGYSPLHYRKDDFFWRRTVQWKFLPLSEIKEILNTADSLNNYPFPDYNPKELFAEVPKEQKKFESYKDMYLLWLNYPMYYQNVIQKEAFLLRRKKNQDEYDKMRRNYGYTPLGTKPENSGITISQNRKTFEQAPLLTHYLKLILRLCQEKNIQVHLFHPPVNESTYKQIDPQYQKSFSLFFYQLQKQFPEVQVELKLSWLPDNHFGDPNHLNPGGAFVYTKDLIQRYLPQETRKTLNDASKNRFFFTNYKDSIKFITQGWGKPYLNRSLRSNPVSIQGNNYNFALATHSHSQFKLNLNRKWDTFIASLGIDEEVRTNVAEHGEGGSGVFVVKADGNEIFRSSKITLDTPPQRIQLDVRGVQTLELITEDAGDGNDFDHTTWAKPYFLFYDTSKRSQKGLLPK